jgi:hypothetical protein
MADPSGQRTVIRTEQWTDQRDTRGQTDYQKPRYAW